MKINKRGQSTNLVLIVGIILATSISVFAVYSTFDDIVRDMVMGDPDIAAREIASYMDIAASAPNEITIYANTPMTIAGFPAYGTILVNAKDQNIRVHPFPQDLMQSQILKSIYGEISVEEVATVAVLYDMRNTDVFLNAQRKAAQKASASILREEGVVYNEKAGRYQAAAGGCCGGKSVGRAFVSQADVDSMIVSKKALPKNNLVREVNPATGKWQYRAKDGGCFGGKYAGGQFVSHADVDDILKKQGPSVYDDAISKSNKKIAKKKALKATLNTPVKGKIAKLNPKNWKRFRKLVHLLRPANIVDFLGKKVSSVGRFAWNNKVVKSMRGVTKKAAKKMGTRIVTWVGSTAAFKATAAVEKADWTGVTAVVRRVAFAALSVGEGFLTFWPIHRSIVNSHAATQQIEDKFGTFEFHTGNTDIHVEKPNCHSERYAIDADIDIPYVGEIGLDAVLGRQFNMPMSNNSDRIRTYSKITNNDDECYDAHNVYLNQDGEVIRDTLGDALANHPYATTVGVPFAACVTMGFVEPSWGSGCIMGMEAAILGAWANSDNFYTEGLPYEGWSGNLFMVGLGAAVANWGSPVSMGALALYLTFPADSSTVFSFVSDSGRLINTTKEYYMEDPLLLTISKEYDEDKDEYVIVVDKAL